MCSLVTLPLCQSTSWLVTVFFEDKKLPGYVGIISKTIIRKFLLKKHFLCVFFIAWPCVVQDLIDMKLQNDGISKDSKTPAGNLTFGPLGKGDPYLGGGFKDFLFSPLFGEDFPFD